MFGGLDARRQLEGVRGQGSGIGQPYCRVYMLNSQGFSQSTNTRLNFDTVFLDTKGWWDATNKRYVPQIAGRYRFSLNVGFAGSGTTAAGVYYGNAVVRKNGTNYSQYSVYAPSAIPGNGWTIGGQIVDEVQLNGTTDYIDAAVYSDNTTPAITGNGVYITGMTISYIGP